MADCLEGIAIHPFKDPDFNRLIELTNHTYVGQEIADAEYLDWEYLQNPDGPSLISVAEEHEKIVSQYLVLPRTYKVNSQRAKGSLSVNTLTHPGYRGKQLFPKLAELTYAKCRENEILFTTGFPNPVSSPVFSGKLNFHSVGRIPFYLKPLRPFRSLKKYLNKLEKKRGAVPILRLDFLDSGNSSVFNISPFKFQTDKKQYEDFHSGFLEDKANCAERGFDFLKWRYFDVPIREYHVVKIEKENCIKALVVLRSAQLFGMTTMIIMDLLFINETDSKKAANLLLTWVSAQAVSNAMDLVVIARQDSTPGIFSLLRHGFLQIPSSLLPQPLEFILRIHSENVKKPDIFKLKNWYLSFGDSDIF